jgi:ATP-dependent helicase HrpB
MRLGHADMSDVQFNSGLPIDEVLPDLVEDLERDGAAVLVAETGAGKTTQVPQAILDAGLIDPDETVLVLEPRRVAARATARRIAQERGADLGGEVGYQVRFDRRIRDDTRIAIVTEGILTARLQSDPFLEGVGAVVLDEFHERSVHADLAIAFLKEVRTIRTDMKVCVMSATIDPQPVSEFLDAPVIEAEGRTYPVDIRYQDAPSEDDLAIQAARGVRRAIQDPEDDGGDILVFMPGRRTIEETVEILETMDVCQGIEIHALYGALPPEKQDAAIEPSDGRKIIVATNIAETSLTIEGVTTVVDSGKFKQMRMSPASGLDRLETAHVSHASADQRAGRAGRTRPGRAYRLWTPALEHRMDQEGTAEILRVDITGPVLEVIAWSGMDPREFDWFEKPPSHALDRAIGVLRRLDAIPFDDFYLTPTGKRMRRVPAHPRIARMILEASRRGSLRRVAGMAAILSERDFVLSMDRDAPTEDGDLLARVDVLDSVASGRRREARGRGMKVHVGRARQVARARDQLVNMVEEHERLEDPAEIDIEARKSVALGFPDRICLRRGGDRNYVMTGGEPLALAYESVVRDAELLVAPKIAGETRGRDTGGVESRGLIRLATRFERAWLNELFGRRLDVQVDIEFDEEREQVMAFRRRSLDGVTLEEDIVSVQDHADAGEVTERLLQEALPRFEYAFELSDDGEQFLKRVETVRRWRPELEIPPVWPGAQDDGEKAMRELYVRMCWGARSFEDLRRTEIRSSLKQQLDHRQIRAIQELAPETIEVPSGRVHDIEYDPGSPPVLAVRIQELFGWEQGPRVAGGDIPVRLHLLAPNFRPQQITDDLASFWDNTYPEVRKELRARYPKHPWPENPRQASAVAK